jgi:hypothetical protein
MNVRTHRVVPVGIALLIMLLSALAALMVSGGHDAAAHGTDRNAAASHMTMARGAGTVSASEFALHEEMRRLWEEHVAWTRLAVISLTTDAPDTKATVGRLLQNQTDLGNAIKPYYGAAAGRQLTALLRQHILIAADLIAVAKSGDAAGVTSQEARWTANADQIATLLNKANPVSWKLGPMKAMMHDHLRLTTDEVVARLQHKWAADVRAYDRIHLQILHMSDMLASGIVTQFPARFS